MVCYKLIDVVDRKIIDRLILLNDIIYRIGS